MFSHVCPSMMDGAISFLAADAIPGAAPLPLSAVLRVAQPLAPLMSLTTPAPAASPAVPGAASPETPLASGGDERPSELNSPSEPDQEPEAEPEAESDAETEEEKARRLLYCSLCKVAVNSASQLEAHNSGKRQMQTRVFVIILTEHKRSPYLCFPHRQRHDYSISRCATALKNTPSSALT